MSLVTLPTPAVIPVQAGIHPEIAPQPQGSSVRTISGWTTAEAYPRAQSDTGAGVTPRLSTEPRP
jgi:hypothetical protein